MRVRCIGDWVSIGGGLLGFAGRFVADTQWKWKAMKTVGCVWLLQAVDWIDSNPICLFSCPSVYSCKCKGGCMAMGMETSEATREWNWRSRVQIPGVLLVTDANNTTLLYAGDANGDAEADVGPVGHWRSQSARHFPC